MMPAKGTFEAGTLAPSPHSPAYGVISAKS